MMQIISKQELNVLTTDCQARSPRCEPAEIARFVPSAITLPCCMQRISSRRDPL
jgi:hypothetical protein